jgi:hypothetical protein
MAKEATQSPYQKLIFREVFLDEQSVRKNGGEDLSGKAFGDLIVLSLDSQTQSGLNRWWCECVCGKVTSVRSSDLRSGKTKSCGCLRSRKAPPIDLSGERFEKLLVIDHSHKENGRHFWNCICDCGNASLCATGTLNSGGATQCYGCGRKFLPSGQSGRTALYRQYKHDAKKRGYEFNLSKDDFKELTSLDCVYCGSSPACVMKTNTTDDHGDYTYNGIDRVDNSAGYEIGNCVTCCKTCNWMKLDLCKDDFFSHIEKVYNNIKND